MKGFTLFYPQKVTDPQFSHFVAPPLHVINDQSLTKPLPLHPLPNLSPPPPLTYLTYLLRPLRSPQASQGHLEFTPLGKLSSPLLLRSSLRAVFVRRLNKLNYPEKGHGKINYYHGDLVIRFRFQVPDRVSLEKAKTITPKFPLIKSVFLDSSISGPYCSI